MVTINSDELNFQFVRSSGPGGQHVNKTSTKVILSFNLATSNSFTDEEKIIIYKKLNSNLDNEGNLQVVCQETRSQHKNKTIAITKLRSILTKALVKPKFRVRTKPTRSSQEKRLRLKTEKSQTKKLRGKVQRDE
ncbi:MAG: aminoacyl-tRNA hydrolase [Calditrichaeota bacterium]|nr:MAG: aminoacyl-tRNA hydrolase [Calditrichota bacterium]